MEPGDHSLKRQSCPGIDRLACFAFLWAAATLAHHAASPWWFDRYAVLNIGLVAAALVVLVRPRSITAFAALAALGLVNVVKQAPFHPNHILFGGFVDAILLAALLLHRLRWNAADAAEGREREALFNSFAAPIRIAYLLLFGFAFLHKLNSDFLDTDVSCGVMLPERLLAQYGLPPLGAWLRRAVVLSALSIEAAIPVGLLFVRTRFFALVLALGFHLLLALNQTTPLYSFAAEMLAVLFLFTPSAFIAGVSQTLTEIRPALRGQVAKVAAALALGVVVVGLFDADARRMMWNVWAWTLVGIFARSCWHCGPAFRIENAFRVRPRVFWAFLLLLVLNGSSPYLGLKTQTSFSMYSNLRTEGGRTNHLFLGRLDIGTWQDDLVEIIDSNLPDFRQARDDQVLLTYFEFRRTAGTAGRHFRVEYRHRGEERTLVVGEDAAGDQAAATPPAWWLRKLLCFRAVERNGPTRCRH